MHGQGRLVAEILFHRLFQAADLCGDVGLADAQHLRDLLIAVPIQIEEEERLVQRILSVNKLMQEEQFFRWVCRLFRDVQETLVSGKHMPRPYALAATVGDRDVQSDPVHPGRKPTARIKSAEGAPELDQDLLSQILPVVPVSAVRVADLIEDLLVLLDEGLEPLLLLRRGHRTSSISFSGGDRGCVTDLPCYSQRRAKNHRRAHKNVPDLCGK